MVENIIKSIVLLLFIAGFIVYLIYAKNKDRKILVEYNERKQKFLNEHPEATSEEYELPPFDEIEFKEKKMNIISIGIYCILFFAVAEFISSFLQGLYIGINNIDIETLQSSSELYDPEAYESLVMFVTPITNFVVYLITFIVIMALNFKYYIKDLKAFKKKYFLLVFAGFGLLLAASLVGSYILLLLGIEGDPTNERIINEIMTSSALNRMLMIFPTVLFAPFIEEYIFRKCIFNLCNNSDRKGLAISSVAFGLLHVVSTVLQLLLLMVTGAATYTEFINEFVNIIVYALMGFALGYVYMKSNHNVIVSISSHLLNNLLSTLATIFGTGMIFYFLR